MTNNENACAKADREKSANPYQKYFDKLFERGPLLCEGCHSTGAYILHAMKWWCMKCLFDEKKRRTLYERKL